MLESVGKLAIGAAQFGMDYGIANNNGQVNKDNIKNILNLAWENGIDAIDTAKAYGDSEKSIGHYIKEHPETLWKIVTKISNTDTSLVDQVTDSSQNLTILPTTILAHSSNIYLDKRFQEDIAKVKENQLISKFGVSLYDENDINKVMDSAIKPDIIQIPLSILDTRLYRSSILNQVIEKGVEVHVRSAFLQGLLYLSESDLKDRFEDAVPSIDKLKFIASKAGITLTELSLLWLISLEEVSKVIIGMDNVDQLKAHLKTLTKKVDSAVFEDALCIHYENETILNPSLW